MSDAGNLQDRRLDAALRTKGISSGPIYDRILAVIEQQGWKGDLLDFGAGSGGLSRRLLQSGQFRSITALDIQPRPSSLPGEIVHIVADLNHAAPLQSESFDVVVSAEVVEHLENPREIMREWFRVLRKGGWVIFSTPNNESWRSLLSLFARGHFAGFSDENYPAHITALLARDVQRLALEAGFGHPSIFYTDHGYLPRFTRFTWQNILSGGAKGRRFSDNLIAFFQKPGS